MTEEAGIGRGAYEIERDLFQELKKAEEQKMGLLARMEEIITNAPDREIGTDQAIEELGAQYEEAMRRSREAFNKWMAAMKKD